MSKAEILAALFHLTARERQEVLEQLCRLEGAEGPTARVIAVLEEAQSAFDADPNAGAPWSEVERRLRKRQ